MNRISRIASALLSMLVALVVSGCLSYYTTERAAIVIFNDTGASFEYTFFHTDRWTESHRLAAGDVDYVFTYEEKAPSDPLLVQLTQLRLNTPTCTAILPRHELEKRFIKNPEGRHGWDLHVTQQLLIQADCK